MSIEKDPVGEHYRKLGLAIEAHKAQSPQPGNYSSPVFGDFDVEKHRSKKITNGQMTNYGGMSAFGFFSEIANRFLPRMPTVGGMSLGLGPDMLDQLARQGKGLATNLIAGWLDGNQPGPSVSHPQLGKQGLLNNTQWGISEKGISLGKPFPQGTTVKDRIDQFLEKRGYLSFSYSPKGSNGAIERILPFFENPKITESQSTKYHSTPIMNRNEPWRLWVGSEPTKLKLSFSITLPHVFEFFKRLQNENSLSMRDASSITQIEDPFVEFGVPGVDYDGLKTRMKESDTYAMTTDDYVNRAPGYTQTVNPGDILIQYYVYCMSMLKVIRSSVVRSSGTQNVLGPPLVGIRFGELYSKDSNLQWIVKNYSLKLDGKHGYEVETLLPRVIDVSLSLESFSQGPSGGKRLAPGGWNDILEVKQ